VVVTHVADLSTTASNKLGGGGGAGRCQHDDPAEVIRCRTRGVLAGSDGVGWQDPDGAVRALNIAATVLGQL
jgi:hypothetical protein